MQKLTFKCEVCADHKANLRIDTKPIASQLACKKLFDIASSS